jgi:hypothetical protein
VRQERSGGPGDVQTAWNKGAALLPAVVLDAPPMSSQAHVPRPGPKESHSILRALATAAAILAGVLLFLWLLID